MLQASSHFLIRQVQKVRILWRVDETPVNISWPVWSADPLAYHIDCPLQSQALDWYSYNLALFLQVADTAMVETKDMP
jgi:hypothetical protein